MICTCEFFSHNNTPSVRFFFIYIFMQPGRTFEFLLWFEYSSIPNINIAVCLCQALDKTTLFVLQNQLLLGILWAELKDLCAYMWNQKMLCNAQLHDDVFLVALYTRLHMLVTSCFFSFYSVFFSCGWPIRSVSPYQKYCCVQLLWVAFWQ